MKTDSAGIIFFGVLLLYILGAGLRPVEADDLKRQEEMRGNKVEAVLDRHRDELMAIAGVVGVAEGRCNGKSCIKVYVKHKAGAAGNIPPLIEGFPVSVEETGQFRSK